MENDDMSTWQWCQKKRKKVESNLQMSRVEIVAREKELGTSLWVCVLCNHHIGRRSTPCCPKHGDTMTSYKDIAFLPSPRTGAEGEGRKRKLKDKLMRRPKNERHKWWV